MYQIIKQLYGKKLSATDGLIGHVTDFYFDDKTWMIRYLVANTGSWLQGRQVLLSPNAFAGHAFGESDIVADLLLVNLTRKQIEDSPTIESHRPVSRQFEEDYYRYYGWPTYWLDGGMSGVTGFPTIEPPLIPEDLHRQEHEQQDDLHLCSTRAITGYHIQAIDGPIGSVSGFTVDGGNWAIREMVAQTGHWYSSKEILVLTENIGEISHEESTVVVNLTKENLRQTMNNDVVQASASHR